MNLTLVENRVKVLFLHDAGGHDFFHTLRVYRTAMSIAEKEPCNPEIVALGALLHDADDKKLFSTENYANARAILREYGASPQLENAVIEVISTVSFGGSSTIPATVEGRIVQDADRLDAIGAIGIARTFAYGGSHGTPMHDPGIPPRIGMTTEEYRSHKGTSLNHFYEKLFRLKETLNTHTAKEMALHRDAFLHRFVEEFLAEWDGIR